MIRFVAIDFEIADYGPDSACAVALVTAVGGEIVRREQYLIRPPRRSFVFTYLHGIDWRQVAGEPIFKDLWPTLRQGLSDADFLAAHNAHFDQGVLNAGCAAAGVEPPSHRFVCTVRLARSAWGIYPTRLPDVCRFLGIRLRHHDPLSDAEVCARIVLASQEHGKKSALVPMPVR